MGGKWGASLGEHVINMCAWSCLIEKLNGNMVVLENPEGNILAFIIQTSVFKYDLKSFNGSSEQRFEFFYTVKSVLKVTLECDIPIVLCRFLYIIW